MRALYIANMPAQTDPAYTQYPVASGVTNAAIGSRLCDRSRRPDDPRPGRPPSLQPGVQQLPAITTHVDDAINLFSDNRAKFHSADAIPTTWLPYTVGPWMLIGFGALLVVLGAAVALGR